MTSTMTKVPPGVLMGTGTYLVPRQGDDVRRATLDTIIAEGTASLEEAMPRMVIVVKTSKHRRGQWVIGESRGVWPRFVRGWGGILDIGNGLGQYTVSRRPDRTDARAVRSDWAAVGNSLRYAFRTLGSKR